MRRIRLTAVAATLAVLGAALLATSASAIDHHFVVKMHYLSSHHARHGFVRKDRLVDFYHQLNRVGRDRWKCHARAHPDRTKCKGFIHLNGEKGGKGAIRVRGTIKHNDPRLEVLGGSRQFDGVAGTVSWKGVRLYFDLAG